jgi:hypothetical protein
MDCANKDELLKIGKTALYVSLFYSKITYGNDKLSKVQLGGKMEEALGQFCCGVIFLGALLFGFIWLITC